MVNFLGNNKYTKQNVIVSQLTCVCCLCPLGGAPNYYPNSFSAPEIQPQCVESKFKVHPDVARYNSSDDDNVTQVGKKKTSFTIFSQLCIRFHLLSSWPACCSSYHCIPSLLPLNIWLDTSRIQVLLCLSLQVRTFYTKVLNEEERQRLCQNFAGSLKGAQLFIQKRMVSSHTISTPVSCTIFPFLSGAQHIFIALEWWTKFI